MCSACLLRAPPAERDTVAPSCWPMEKTKLMRRVCHQSHHQRPAVCVCGASQWLGAALVWKLVVRGCLVQSPEESSRRAERSPPEEAHNFGGRAKMHWSVFACVCLCVWRPFFCLHKANTKLHTTGQLQRPHRQSLVQTVRTTDRHTQEPNALANHWPREN